MLWFPLSLLSLHSFFLPLLCFVPLWKVGCWSHWSSWDTLRQWDLPASGRFSWELPYGSSPGSSFAPSLHNLIFNLHRRLLFTGIIILLLTVLQVIFLHPAPLHPHIYSNGHICLGMFCYSYRILSIILWHTLLLQGFVMCCFLCLFVLFFMLSILVTFGL